MGPTPVRATAVEQALVGQGVDAIESASATAADGTSPATDSSASAEYRTHLVKVLTRRALTAACAD
jgi:carbon-monoxide dehydrogenase medium subunit